jgi:hypothetical protein
MNDDPFDAIKEEISAMRDDRTNPLNIKGHPQHAEELARYTSLWQRLYSPPSTRLQDAHTEEGEDIEGDTLGLCQRNTFSLRVE